MSPNGWISYMSKTRPGNFLAELLVRCFVLFIFRAKGLQLPGIISISLHDFHNHPVTAPMTHSVTLMLVTLGVCFTHLVLRWVWILETLVFASLGSASSA